MRHALAHLGIACVALALAGCGTPGAPQPPSLRLPKPVSDLQAIRKGDDVYLRWSVPQKTTDGSSIRPAGFGSTRICRGSVTQQPDSCRDVAADIETRSDASGAQTAIDHIADRVGGNRDFLSYTVEVKNDSDRSAGPSNAVLVFVAPSLAQPPELKAELSAKDISLSWQAHDLPVSSNLRAEYFYRIKRIAKDPAQKQPTEVILAELPATPGMMTYDDRAFAWEKTYEYRVCGVTRVISGDGKPLAEFEGKDSPAAIVTAHDIFPPPIPTGLQAVYSSLDTRRFIDLTWSLNVEADVAGYNVYRAEGPGDLLRFVRLNSAPIAAPAYRDDNVLPGQTFVYQVTAIDSRGNESQRSTPAREKVPE